MLNEARKIRRTQRGAALSEYIILPTLLGAAVVVIIASFGGQVRNTFAGSSEQILFASNPAEEARLYPDRMAALPENPTLTDVYASLPEFVRYQVYGRDHRDAPIDPDGIRIRLTSGDPRLNGFVNDAWCISEGEAVANGLNPDFSDAPMLQGRVIGFTELPSSFYTVEQATAVTVNSVPMSQHIDELHWGLNANFSSNTGWEVQWAVWLLTNSISSSVIQLFADNPDLGTWSNVIPIVQTMYNNGGGFVPGPGQIVGVVIDPGDSDPANTQPFVIGVPWNRLVADL